MYYILEGMSANHSIELIIIKRQFSYTAFNKRNLLINKNVRIIFGYLGMQPL